jgi:hypothetical protein
VEEPENLKEEVGVAESSELKVEENTDQPVPTQA